MRIVASVLAVKQDEKLRRLFVVIEPKFLKNFTLVAQRETLWYKLLPEDEVSQMSRVCQVTGKRPMTGNNVSHAQNKNKRRFMPNLRFHRFWVDSENRYVRLRVSSKGMKIIDKKGIDEVLKDVRASGHKI